MSDFTISTVEQLVDVVGEAHEFVQQKICRELEPEMESFIASSSLLLMSTLDANGLPDVSPKGDPAGFVQVHSPSRIIIPDRPGNKLAMGFRNLLENPVIGLLFVTPNARETLRVKGRASISRDPNLLQSMSVQGKPAILATVIDVQECFFHCGKAMIRSGMWQPESWGEPASSIIARQAARKMQVDEALVETELEKNYRDELY